MSQRASEAAKFDPAFDKFLREIFELEENDDETHEVWEALAHEGILTWRSFKRSTLDDLQGLTKSGRNNNNYTEEIRIPIARFYQRQLTRLRQMVQETMDQDFVKGSKMETYTPDAIDRYMHNYNVRGALSENDDQRIEAHMPPQKKQKSDRSINEIKRKCPIAWEGDEGGSIGIEEVSLSLMLLDRNGDPDLYPPTRDELIKKCIKHYLDPKAKQLLNHHSLEDYDYDFEEAKKLLRKEGKIEKVIEFDDYKSEWAVETQHEKMLSKEMFLSENLKELFDGKHCMYADIYNYIPVTPLTPYKLDYVQKQDPVQRKRYRQEKVEKQGPVLRDLKRAVKIIAKESNSIKHSFWWGKSTSADGEGVSVDRWDCYTIQTKDGTEFLFEFLWRHRLE